MYKIRKILYPTDFSEQAMAAFHVACAMAAQHKADLVVLHVLPPPVAWGEGAAYPPSQEYEDEIRNNSLLPIRPAEPGIKVEHRMENGKPEDMIVAVAQDLGCELIVIGTHGRTGLGRLFMGSVAEKVLRKAPCPVLTVRAPYPAPAEEKTIAKEPAVAH